MELEYQPSDMPGRLIVLEGARLNDQTLSFLPQLGQTVGAGDVDLKSKAVLYQIDQRLETDLDVVPPTHEEREDQGVVIRAFGYGPINDRLGSQTVTVHISEPWIFRRAPPRRVGNHGFVPYRA
ncbi:hypothetical protein [Microbispora sitophila]|uniref:hypothetical protein n=1 Tax=Microbispora sitophila TaxID=2771537 RepID=UPI001868CD07|nr:hypothetical protein [Microbispora sitophila]